MTKTRICRIAAWTCNNWHDPCNTIYAENHAYDHNKIVNIELNSKYFNVAESACLQCMSSASDWSNSTCQPFLTSNWHFWQMVQMSAQCLLCKTEKAQISGQMQIICTGWHLWMAGVKTALNHVFLLVIMWFEVLKSFDDESLPQTKRAIVTCFWPSINPFLRPPYSQLKHGKGQNCFKPTWFMSMEDACSTDP